MIKQKCIFTTHTPVAAGHDKFPIALVARVITATDATSTCATGVLSRRRAQYDLPPLDNSHYINGVAKKHRDVAQHLFAALQDRRDHQRQFMSRPGSRPRSPSSSIVTSPTGGSTMDSLRYSVKLPRSGGLGMLTRPRRRIVDWLNREHYAGFDPEVVTLGFARRATAYKQSRHGFRRSSSA